MMSQPAWRKSLKELANSRPTLADLLAAPVGGKYHDDRTTCIVAATTVEDAVLDTLISRMRKLNNSEHDKLFGVTAPLGSHGARLELAYALEIFGRKTRNDLEVMRLIRNAFAHAHKSISFDTPEIAEACKHLTVVERADTEKFFGSKSIQEKNHNRERFLWATTIYSVGFYQARFPGRSTTTPCLRLD